MANDFGMMGLGGAAGAGKAIAELIAQRLLQARLEEEQRQHAAENALQGRGLDLRSRELDLQHLNRQDVNAENKRQHDLAHSAEVLKTRESVPPGSEVSLADMKQFQDAGISQNSFQPRPANLASVSLSGFQSMPGVAKPSGAMQTEPQAERQAGFTAKPTFEQSIKLSDLAGKNEARTAAIDARITALGQAADRAESAGRLAEANILRATAEAQLATERSKHVGDAKPLPATMQENMAGLNVAEVEGVKVLKELKDSGLHQSNDPFDPRWQKFMVTKLKMAPGDFNKADIQQRTAAVNAMLTRGLMGARPSQYVAAMIQEHLPKGEMTGQQLWHVVNNVLEQAGERRQEIEGLSGRDAGSLSPKSGTSYRQWLDELGRSNQPKVLSTDPNWGRKP